MGVAACGDRLVEPGDPLVEQDEAFLVVGHRAGECFLGAAVGAFQAFEPGQFRGGLGVLEE